MKVKFYVVDNSILEPTEGKGHFEVNLSVKLLAEYKRALVAYKVAFDRLDKLMDEIEEISEKEKSNDVTLPPKVIISPN